jgi:hypothetical protein
MKYCKILQFAFMVFFLGQANAAGDQRTSRNEDLKQKEGNALSIKKSLEEMGVLRLSQNSLFKFPNCTDRTRDFFLDEDILQETVKLIQGVKDFLTEQSNPEFKKHMDLFCFNVGPQHVNGSGASIYLNGYCKESFKERVQELLSRFNTAEDYRFLREFLKLTGRDQLPLSDFIFPGARERQTSCLITGVMNFLKSDLFSPYHRQEKTLQQNLADLFGEEIISIALESNPNFLFTLLQKEAYEELKLLQEITPCDSSKIGTVYRTGDITVGLYKEPYLEVFKALLKTHYNPSTIIAGLRFVLSSYGSLLHVQKGERLKSTMIAAHCVDEKTRKKVVILEPIGETWAGSQSILSSLFHSEGEVRWNKAIEGLVRCFADQNPQMNCIFALPETSSGGKILTTHLMTPSDATDEDTKAMHYALPFKNVDNHRFGYLGIDRVDQVVPRQTQSPPPYLEIYSHGTEGKSWCESAWKSWAQGVHSEWLKKRDTLLLGMKIPEDRDQHVKYALYYGNEEDLKALYDSWCKDQHETLEKSPSYENWKQRVKSFRKEDRKNTYIDPQVALTLAPWKEF